MFGSPPSSSLLLGLLLWHHTLSPVYSAVKAPCAYLCVKMKPNCIAKCKSFIARAATTRASCLTACYAQWMKIKGLEDSCTDSCLKMRRLQPKVTRVDEGAASMAFGSISMTTGSPWCPGGSPMIWWVGHQRFDSPMCLGSDGKWRRNTKVVLDKTDAKNVKRRQPTEKYAEIDRHDW